MKNWILRRNAADYAYLSEELNIDPVAVRIMINRGITDLESMREFLSDDISDCFNYKGLPNIQKGLDIIKEAKADNLKCRIVGDYDADGVTATTVLMKGLTLYGLDCDFVIPNRLIDGYGINTNIVDKAKKDKIGLIVTCDNGISAREAIDAAIDYGIKVVVTDHHTVTESETPTKAGALINPKMHVNDYPFPDICGAFVAFKFLEALFEGDSSFSKIKDELLEFVAIASITDVMPLIDENRKLVKWGLKRLKNAKNLGLKRLVYKCGVAQKEFDVTSFDIGFRIGPCINAAGRIDIAETCVKLFLTDSENVADGICDKLVALNDERKALTEKNVEDGIFKVISKYTEATLPNVIVLYLEDCHVAICGLVAGRIRERFYRPAIVFGNSNGMLTGSGRSIDEFNIIEGVQKCADLCEKFGGHKAACGLTIKEENLLEFTKRINELSNLKKEDLIEKLYIDADMPFGYVSFDLMKDLEKLEPFGCANASPVFARKDLQLISAKKVGADGTHLFISVRDEKNQVRSLKLWKRAAEFEEFLNENFGYDTSELLYESSSKLLDKNIRLTVSYYPTVNNYKNNTSIDFVIKDYKLT